MSSPTNSITAMQVVRDGPSIPIVDPTATPDMSMEWVNGERIIHLTRQNPDTGVFESSILSYDQLNEEGHAAFSRKCHRSIVAEMPKLMQSLKKLEEQIDKADRRMFAGYGQENDKTETIFEKAKSGLYLLGSKISGFFHLSGTE